MVFGLDHRFDACARNHYFWIQEFHIQRAEKANCLIPLTARLQHQTLFLWRLILIRLMPDNISQTQCSHNSVANFNLIMIYVTHQPIESQCLKLLFNNDAELNKHYWLNVWQLCGLDSTWIISPKKKWPGTWTKWLKSHVCHIIIQITNYKNIINVVETFHQRSVQSVQRKCTGVQVVLRWNVYWSLMLPRHMFDPV